MPDPATNKEFLDSLGRETLKLFVGRDKSEGLQFASVVISIVQDYDEILENSDSVGDIGQHRDRLKRIQEAARTLSLLLKNEPLDCFLLDDFESVNPTHPDTQTNDILRAVYGGNNLAAARARFGELLSHLQLVILNSDRLLNKPGELELWRLDYQPVQPNAKPWRSHIWEPIFRLMSSFHVPVPKTTRGPMTRLLTAIHDTLDLEPLEPEAVKKAAEAYRKGKVDIKN